jgi:hypothetical protein
MKVKVAEMGMYFLFNI